MFSATLVKVETLVHIVRNIFYFYDFQEPETCGALNQILLNTGTELCTTHETGTVPGKAARARRSYTECNRRNVRDFGRVFLVLNYTDITQNTYIQS